MRLDVLMQDLAMQAVQAQVQAQASVQAHSETRCEPSTWASASNPTEAWYKNASASRIQTETYLTQILRKAFPDLEVTSLPLMGANPSLLEFASSNQHAKCSPIVDDNDPLSATYASKTYIPPASRINGPDVGRVRETVQFGKYRYEYQGLESLLYIASGRDGSVYSPQITSQLLVHAPTAEARENVDALIRAAGGTAAVLHDEIWIFDGGYWRKDAGLYQSVMRSRWIDVILDEKEKKAIQDDVRHFFDSRKRYQKLRVPWKRGVIYHGPPGNGKTISIKALSHELYERDDPIPTLYVKSFFSYAGPENSIKTIFAKARAEAPCLLVFEDLDALVTDQVRSYFLNEVDGLSTNEGVMMIGSTNHLERLDPGLSKRPSRFDRKYLFDKPNLDERILYCEFWRRKLTDNHDVEFPKTLSPEIARITNDFSFAYMQEAFVGALLAIAFDEEEEDDKCNACRCKKDEFERLVLWKKIKEQVRILREEI